MERPPGEAEAWKNFGDLLADIQVQLQARKLGEAVLSNGDMRRAREAVLGCSQGLRAARRALLAGRGQLEAVLGPHDVAALIRSLDRSREALGNLRSNFGFAVGEREANPPTD